ncbi:spore maturation protein CgeB/GT2 family glycosyltransferase [Rhizobium soli]|uniref:Spore maturation protein CgeB/GT2 family glycosyltransferase n=1 Tax=Rhizobium soli TaxID=424798 RepID=A0A7X0JQ79_9HYPH|nr:spore maturation protein CgeB/GT2 family glycosyltransferase [Rhizobium soli]
MKLFSYQLPTSIFDNATHEFTAAFSETGVSLEGEPVKFDGRRKYSGYVDAINEGILYGWVIEETDVSRSLWVEVIADGELVTEPMPATVFRNDVMVAKGTSGFHGFAIKFSLLPTERERELSVRVSGDSYLLPNRLRIPATTSVKQKDPQIEAYFDNVRGGVVYGWAWDANNPNNSIKLNMYIDHEFISTSTARILRADLVKAGKGTGKYGYNFEIPERFFDGTTHNINILIATTKQDARNSPKSIHLGVNAVHHFANTRVDDTATAFYQLPAAISVAQDAIVPIGISGVGVSVIILSKNGSHLLEQLLGSLHRFNTYPNIEVIIVDHASIDGTQSVVTRWQETLNVKLIKYEANHSFSYSNNRAVEQATGEIVFFLNNDIIFCQDVIPSLVKILDSPSVGVVGLKLLDILYNNNTIMPPQVQHLGINFSVNRLTNELTPFEMKSSKATFGIMHSPIVVPATTGAALMMRKTDFISVGMFRENYFYGYEDVDLCLSVNIGMGLNVVCANNLAMLHHRGYSRYNVDSAFSARAGKNAQVLRQRFGAAVRRRHAASLFNGDSSWSGSTLNIAFAVSEASMNSDKADFFTAWELGDELAKQFKWNIYYLDKTLNWYDLQDIDVLVVMRDDYDLRQIKNAKPSLMKIGWARNWFERWPIRPWFRQYDLCLASSELGRNYLAASDGMRSGVLRIGGNAERFERGAPVAEYSSDYCFTGSFFGHRRDILDALEPSNVPFEFALYGYNWEKLPKFSKYYRGGLAYNKMPEVYSSTRILIDDANHVTKSWGSTNSRVFDALLAGCLVITNSETSSAEAFNGLLPVYHSQDELEDLIVYYLENETERKILSEKLREVVVREHTYRLRATEFRAQIRDFFCEKLRISIKIGAPGWDKAYQWGDYHFALAMKKSFERYGHFVRIDVLPDWNGPASNSDDVVIVLRGLSSYKPKPDQINLMWNISHPNAVSVTEYETYDHIFVASHSYAQELKSKLTVPVSVLLQCADPSVFYPCENSELYHHKMLFVGNSRNVFRPVVAAALELKLPVDIFGSDWSSFVPPHLVKGDHIPNSELRRHYAGSDIVLNDHWSDMSALGFLSNRIFDVGACGGFVLSDHVHGMEETFSDFVVTYTDADDFRSKVEFYSRNVEERKRKASGLAAIIRSHHTFDNRIDEMLSVIQNSEKAKSSTGCK